MIIGAKLALDACCTVHSTFNTVHVMLLARRVWESCRPWSAGGFTGRPKLNSCVSEGQLLPGTVAWSSPRNHIGVHPESLLFNRDPEQLAEDVIGLSAKYAALENEHVSISSPAPRCPDLPCAALPCPALTTPPNPPLAPSAAQLHLVLLVCSQQIGWPACHA